MSNVATVTPTTTTVVRTSVLRAFKPHSVESLVSYTLPYPDDYPLTPRDIRMDGGTMRAALGGGVNAQSIVRGLAFGLVVFAHQKGLDTLCEGLPADSEHALRHACGLIAGGKGVMVKDAKAAIISAVRATLALPVKKAKLDSVTAPSPVATIEGYAVVKSDSAESDNGPVRHSYGDALRTTPLGAAEISVGTEMLGGSLDNGAADHCYLNVVKADEREGLARAAAVKAENERKAWEARCIANYAAREADVRQKAVAFCELATSLGIKLTAVQLKALDKLESKAA